MALHPISWPWPPLFSSSNYSISWHWMPIFGIEQFGGVLSYFDVPSIPGFLAGFLHLRLTSRTCLGILFSNINTLCPVDCNLLTCTYLTRQLSSYSLYSCSFYHFSRHQLLTLVHIFPKGVFSQRNWLFMRHFGKESMFHLHTEQFVRLVFCKIVTLFSWLTSCFKQRQ